uniref:Uncharacterized protein n=1 Tax=Ascaris lumbricoides TaxID=6252 RepID=A0A9J2P2W8_ASCLU
KGKNLDPKTDDQPFPRRLLEIQELSKRYEQAIRMPKKRRSRNHIFEESHRAGFERRKFESAKRLLKRVGAITTEEIKEKRMLIILMMKRGWRIERCVLKAKYELAGRDMRQVEADYKKMEESRERRKRKRLKQEMKESRKPNVDVKHNEDKRLHENEKLLHPKMKRKLSRKEAYRERKRAAQVSERNEMILDAKEVIAFGSRVDAPPVFASKQRRKLESDFSKAGSKPLLLKSNLEAQLGHNKGIKKCSANETKEREEAIAAERTRVIEAYRLLKKNRKNLTC